MAAARKGIPPCACTAVGIPRDACAAEGGGALPGDALPGGGHAVVSRPGIIAGVVAGVVAAMTVAANAGGGIDRRADEGFEDDGIEDAGVVAGVACDAAEAVGMWGCGDAAEAASRRS